MFDAEEEPGDLVAGDGEKGLVLGGVVHFYGVVDSYVEGSVLLRVWDYLSDLSGQYTRDP